MTDGTTCNDGNACTFGETCQGGVCAGGSTTVCAPLDSCHLAGTCDPQTHACTNPPKPNGSPCDDGNACTQTDTCRAGVCNGSSRVVCTALD